MTIRLPAMQALRAFEAVARTGSLSRAGEALHLTHGAISHQVKALEEELGVRLVERAGRGIRLTDEGERFATRVRGALAEIGAAMSEIVNQKNPRQLTVSVVPSFAARWLLPRMRKFMNEHPEIDIDVRATLNLADFRRDDVDVAVRYGMGSWPGLTAQLLMEDAFSPVCSPHLPQGVPAQPQDMARYTLLRSEDEYWEPWFRAAGLPWPEPTRGPTFNDSAHMLQAAAEGQGIALGRSSLTSMDLLNGTLVQPFPITVPSDRKFYLVYPPSFSASPKLAVFRTWLVGEISGMAEPTAKLRTVPASPRRAAKGKGR
ncbi:MAG: transcriptional regulator GcvA [Casimicrobiaceae bacterium]